MIEIAGVRLDLEREATQAAHARSEAEGDSPCTCTPCCNIRKQMPSILGDAALDLLSRSGIDVSKPAEFIHINRGDDGHFYAVVYGALGRVVSGAAVRRDFQGGSLEPFMLPVADGIRLLVSETYFPVQEALRGPESFQDRVLPGSRALGSR